MKKITEMMISEFLSYLRNEEKSEETQKKYIRDVKAFIKWCNGAEIEKELVLKYKQEIINDYAPASVNSMLSSLNSFFEFCGRYDLKVKALKIQRNIFAQKEKELTRSEYERLVRTAKDMGNRRLYLLMQTICSSGIRVSELQYITVESLKSESAKINCKGKIRNVFLPKELCRRLMQYAKSQKIKSGAVFVTRTGKPLNRSNIWSDMKKLCQRAGVGHKKVFPHNLRHLFARTYYSIQKDIVRLADILGHSSVDTTRIYTMETGEVHRRQIQKLGLLRV